MIATVGVMVAVVVFTFAFMATRPDHPKHPGVALMTTRDHLIQAAAFGVFCASFLALMIRLVGGGR